MEPRLKCNKIILAAKIILFYFNRLMCIVKSEKFSTVR